MVRTHVGLLFPPGPWPLVPEGGRGRNCKQGSDGCDYDRKTELAFWECTSVRQVDFIPEYREVYTMRTAVGASPNLRLATWSYHTAGTIPKYHMDSRGAFAGSCVKGHP